MSFRNTLKEVGFPDSFIRRYEASKVSMRHVKSEYKIGAYALGVALALSAALWQLPSSWDGVKGYFLVSTLVAYPFAIWCFALGVKYHCKVIAHNKRKRARMQRA